MLPVFDFDPAIGSSTAVNAVTVFRDQPLQPHQAGVPEQVRPDLALLERRQVDAVNAARQHQRNGREEQRSARTSGPRSAAGFRMPHVCAAAPKTK